MFRIEKTLTFSLLLLLATLLVSPFFKTEAKFLDIKTSASIYLSLDLTDPSKIGLELSFINKIDLKGEYNSEDKSLKVKVSTKDLDLNQLSKYVKLPAGEAVPLGIAGYIKEGDLDIEIGEITSLKGNLEANELKFATKNISLRGNIKLLGYF